MNTNTDTLPANEFAISPGTIARFTGLFYLITMAAGIVAQGFIANRLISMDSAATTAARILAHKSLFELGFTLYLIEMASNVTMIVLFYRLLKPAGATLSLLAAALGLTGCVIKTFSRVFYIVPLFMLEGSLHVQSFTPGQVEAQALVLLKINDQGAGMALAFSGFYAFLTGWLILRSTFLPKFLGVISILAGIGWLSFLSPTWGFEWFMYLAAFGFLGAVLLILWLLIAGVNESRWRQQARAVSATATV